MIRVDDLGKRYRQYHDRGSLLARMAGRGRGRRVQEIWALRHLDFEVERGATVGIIGRNGSGKTTLLRLLSGVTGPTEGRLRVAGRLASLIGIGVGFNHELTGRENVVVNGRLLGMSAAEVSEKYERIVAFAELEDFVDVPVKFYSSGMFLRLAFAVAIHTDPDVLLIDEILAVGDIGFQTKCFDRMAELREAGTTILVVTHNLQLLQRLTPRTIVLDQGRVRFDGATDEAMALYHQMLQEHLDAHPRPATPGDVRYTNTARLEVTIEDEQGRPSTQVRNRCPMSIRVDATFTEPVEDPVLAMLIECPGIGRMLATASTPRGAGHAYGPDRPMTARLRLADVPLLPATYSARVELRSARQNTVYGVKPAVLFHVAGDRPGTGSVDFGPTMEIDREPVEIVEPRLVGPAARPHDVSSR